MSAESFANELAKREALREAFLERLEQTRRQIVATRFSDPSALLKLAAAATQDGKDLLAGFFSDIAESIIKGEYDSQVFLDAHPEYTELDVPVDYGQLLPEFVPAFGLLGTKTPESDGGVKNLVYNEEGARIDRMKTLLQESGIITDDRWVGAAMLRRMVVIPEGQSRAKLLSQATSQAKKEASDTNQDFVTRGKKSGTEYTLETAAFLLNSFVGQGLSLDPEAASKKKVRTRRPS